MGKIKEIIQYEAESSVNVFKYTSTWLTIFTGLALVSVIIKSYSLAMVCMIVALILKFKLDYESGNVTAHMREKHNIPNQTKIKKLKEQVS